MKDKCWKKLQANQTQARELPEEKTGASGLDF